MPRCQPTWRRPDTRPPWAHENHSAVVPAPVEKGHLVEPDAHLAEVAELARAKALSDVLVEITAGMARQDCAEEQLAQANAQLATQAEGLREGTARLEQRVLERTAELVAANAKLSQQEAALRYQATVLDNIQDAIVAYDMDLHITAWNHRAEEQYGWTAEEALGGYAPAFVGSQTARTTGPRSCARWPASAAGRAS